jgi:hypothetical protein
MSVLKTVFARNARHVHSMLLIYSKYFLIDDIDPVAKYFWNILMQIVIH